MDPLAELAYDFTPYRYGFNNPVFWSDATGLFETEDDAKGYMKANKLSGSRVEFDADTNLWKIIDGNVTITKIGNMINKIYVIGDQIHLSQTRAGGGGGGSNWLNKLIVRVGALFSDFRTWSDKKLSGGYYFYHDGDPKGDQSLKKKNYGFRPENFNASGLMQVGSFAKSMDGTGFKYSQNKDEFFKFLNVALTSFNLGQDLINNKDSGTDKNVSDKKMILRTESWAH